MSNDTISLIITVFIAFIGYLVTYFNSLRLSQHSEQLKRVNRQLGELYGPLFAIFHSSKEAWSAFREKYRPGVKYFDENIPLTEEDLKAWRLWMSTVFMPNNLRAYEIILSKSDLLIESEMPKCLRDFCAHVTAYQTVIKKWNDQDFSEHKSLINYPRPELDTYIQKSFETLKEEQANLIGKK